MTNDNDDNNSRGMTLAEFNLVFERQSKYELAMLDTDTSTIDGGAVAPSLRMWNAATQALWADDATTTPFLPMLVSSRAVGKSGYGRRQELMSLFPDGHRDVLQAVYNKEDATVFLTRLTRGEAASVWSKAAAGSSSSDVRLQPLLPMCKVQEGVLASTEPFRSSSDRTAVIRIELADGVSSGTTEEGTRVAQELVDAARSRNREAISQQLRRVFPYSWSAILPDLVVDDDKNDAVDVKIAANNKGNRLTLLIERGTNDFHQAELLSLIACVAEDHRVVSVEVQRSINLEMDQPPNFSLPELMDDDADTINLVDEEEELRAFGGKRRRPKKKKSSSKKGL